MSITNTVPITKKTDSTNCAMMETVSVISVCFNEEPKKIRDTLTSIIEQDYKNIEIIVIDGGSKKDTLDAFAEYRNYISYMVSEPDDGIFHAMNKGCSKATGEWIIFMNIGDKFYNTQSLTALMAGADREVDILYGNVTLNNMIIKPPKKVSKYNLYSSRICHQAVLARRSLFLRIGSFDLSYKLCGDPEWIIRAYKNRVAFKYVDVIVAIYEGHGISANIERRQPYWEKLLNQHYSKTEVTVYWVISIFERAFRRIANLDFSMPKGVKRLISRS